MKVIKRDGRAVDYDREKIEIAIEKANTEVSQKERAKKEEIEEIINYIERLNKKRILVEDIQDIIELKLMEIKRYELAKRYIVYRYTRQLVRKQNSTDEMILGLLRNETHGSEEQNSKKNTMLVSTQRDYIAGEVSRDLTRRILLPEKISKAHQDGIIYFHNMDYFIQPIINSCLINIQDMLDNGTVINGKMIETPKSFRVACTVTTQIIASVASNQYGEQIIEIKHLGKYLKKSKDKFRKMFEQKYKEMIPEKILKELIEDKTKEELVSGVQTILYQLNTLMTSKGEPPHVTLLLKIEDDDPYKNENTMIKEEIIKQKNKGIKNENGEYIVPRFPKLEEEIINNKYIFNQGVVSINLSQVAIAAEGNKEKFWNILKERLEICYEALMCRHYALLGTKADASPIHWRYGAIARLNKGEKIDALLKSKKSSITLGYIGIDETIRLIIGEGYTSKKGHDFENKIMKNLKNTIKEWKALTGLEFILCDTTSNL